MLASSSRLHPRGPVTLALLVSLVLALLLGVEDASAAASLTVTPITWNVVGLDSNDVTKGPNRFPSGIRVCNTGSTAATNVQAAFAFDPATASPAYTPSPYISIADGLSRAVGTLAAGACTQVYWTVQVTRDAAAYDTSSRFQVTVTADTLAPVTGPANREIYVEKLVSQNRNAVIQPTPVVAGVWFTGPSSVRVGQTVTYVVTTKTATQGYEQLVHFTDFPSTMFRIVSTSTSYTAPAGGTNPSLYADACGWDAVRTSATYRSCIGPAGFTGGKAGGNPITTTYTLRVVGTGTASIATAIYDFSGSSYHYNSDFGTSVTAITAAANQAPVAVADNTTTTAGTAKAISVLTNDSDPEGDAITVTSSTSPSHGTVTCTTTTCTYTPAGGFSGTDTFTYTITDALGATATATVTVTVNDPPTAVNDATTAVAGVAKAITVLTNDTDPNNDPLVITGSTAPTHGVASCTSTACTYTATVGYAGTDTFTYTVSDGKGGTSTATVTVTVSLPPNLGPDAIDDAAGAVSGGGVLIPVRTNDTDPEGDTLTIVANGSATNGAVVCTSTDCTYLPNAFFVGTDTFTYTISDGHGHTDTATVTVTVTAPPNSPPVAVDDAVTTPSGVAVPVTVTTNDTDANNDTLQVTGTTAPAHGTVVCGTQTCTYTPVAGYVGSDTFDYTISDGHGGTDTGTVAITVTNRAPIAVADAVTTASGVAVPVPVLSNDSDLDGHTLTVSAFTAATSGTVTCVASGCTYTPVAGFVGTATFTYTVSDGHGGTAIATATITVTNTVPTAVDDAATTTIGVPAPIAVVSNDTDPDGHVLTVTSTTSPTHGSVACTASSCTYTPTPGYVGTDTFDYTVSDGHGGTDTATVTVTVTNTPPDAIDDAASTTAGVAKAISVITNDVDLDGDTLSVSSSTSPAHGSLSCTTTVCTYTPAPGYTGSDSFTYTVSDGHGGSDTATVTVTVTAPANVAPIAVDDNDSTTAGVGVTVPVLTNDTDADSDTLTVVSSTAAAHGLVTCTLTDCTYLPDLSFVGTDTFTYTISDGHGHTATATVTIGVSAPPNTPPVAVDDAASTTIGAAVNVAVIANDTDGDTDPLTVTASTDGAHGTVSCSASACAYTPAPGFVGTDTFTYTISDGKGGTDVATVTVTVANTPPVAVDDAASTGVGAAVSLAVLPNDTDADHDTLTITGWTQPAHGSVSCSGGSCTYTPTPAYVGPDAFTYTISDGHGGSDTATVTVTVTAAPNVAPVAVDDATSTTAGVAVGVSVVGNDTDADNDTLTVSSSADGAHGTVSCTATVCTYSPAGGFTGTDTFTYTISDGHGHTATATVTVTVGAAPNVAPVAVDDATSTTEATPVNVSVVGNDTDADNDTLSVTGSTQGVHGTVSCTATICTYTPDAGFVGSDTFTYTISDGHGHTATANVSVAVSAAPPANVPPVAGDDTASTTVGTPVPVSVLGNDTDADNDTLTVTGSTQGTHGTVSCTSTQCTYAPLAGFSGTDTFSYTISDGNGGLDTATVTVTVTAPPNAAPVAHDDNATTSAGTPVAIAVLGNDTDADNDTLVPSLATAPAHGSVACSTTECTYTPAPGFTGTDSFTYTVADGHGGFSTATVTVTVSAGPPPPNTPPVAVDDAVTTPAGTSVPVLPLGNDSDVDGDPIAIASVTPPSHGTVSCTASQCTYAPAAGFVGIDAFTVTIQDGKGGSATSTVTVTVTATPNTPPAAVADAASTTPVTPVAVAVLANDSDLDGDSIVVDAFTQGAHGTVVCAAGSCTYTPAAGFTGTDTFTYTVSDGKGGFAVATVTVTVGAAPVAPPAPPAPSPSIAAPTNTAPVAVDDAGRVVAGSSLTLPVVANDSDPDGDALTVSDVAQPVRGSVTCTASSCRYTAPVGFAGGVTFTYTVSDGNGGADTALVTIVVTAPAGPRPVTPAPGPAPLPAPAPQPVPAAKKVAPVAKPAPLPGRLVVAMAGRQGTAEPGDLVTYRITIRNAGPGPLEDVVVCDVPADSTVFVRAHGARFVRGQACWTFPRLPAGARRERTVTLRVDRFGVLGVSRNVVIGSAGSSAPQVLGKSVVHVLATPQKGRAGGVAG